MAAAAAAAAAAARVPASGRPGVGMEEAVDMEAAVGRATPARP
jgi:hypothetical protein